MFINVYKNVILHEKLMNIIIIKNNENNTHLLSFYS